MKLCNNGIKQLNHALTIFTTGREKLTACHCTCVKKENNYSCFQIFCLFLLGNYFYDPYLDDIYGDHEENYKNDVTIPIIKESINDKQ